MSKPRKLYYIVKKDGFGNPFKYYLRNKANVDVDSLTGKMTLAIGEHIKTSTSGFSYTTTSYEVKEEIPLPFQGELIPERSGVSGGWICWVFLRDTITNNTYWMKVQEFINSMNKSKSYPIKGIFFFNVSGAQTSLIRIGD